MGNRYGRNISLAFILLNTGIASAGGAPADNAQTVPQFGFANYAWSKVSDDFQAPQSGPGPVMSDKSHPYVANGVAERSGRPITLRVADLDNPILKPWAIDQMRKANELAAAGKQAYEARASCRPGGVPGFMVMGRVNPMYIVQSPKEVVFMNEGGPEIRRVYLNVQHTAHPRVTPYGESVGHYEGDTLVVDTTALSPETFVDNYRTPHTDQEHVIERYKLSDDGKMLQVDIHVEDPGAFNMAWSAHQAYRKGQPEESLNGTLLEAICAENNEVLQDATVASIPKTDKPDF